MKYLVTGYAGFVGRYLAKHLLDEEPGAQVVGIDAQPPVVADTCVANAYHFNLLDLDALTHAIEVERPDFLVHLASYSSVGFSWEHPVASFTNNTNIFLNVLESVRRVSPGTRVLSIGSSEEYGVVGFDCVPLAETAALRPASPYAVARVAQEHLGDVYLRGYNLDIVSTRSFNHIGPGQSDRFVVSGIGKQFAELKLGLRHEIRVGTTSVVRDFLDVRDVVRAYGLLLHKGRKGEVYNICSGVGTTIDEVIRRFDVISGLGATVATDPALIRPVENAVVVGTHAKLSSEVGWSPVLSLDDSLADVFKYWTNQLSTS